MRSTIAKRAGITGTLLVAGLGVAVPAHADPQPATAQVGSAQFTNAGVPIELPAQAPCSTSGPASATAVPVTLPGLRLGGGTSSCTTAITDPETNATTTTSTATGKTFELSALVPLGGPRIRLSTFTVTCTATHTQTNATWSYGGLGGIPNPPNPVPVGYVVPIKKGTTGPVLANAVFNNQVLPGDGSIGLTVLRIDFLPDSGLSGQVSLGETSCSPTP